MAPAKPITNIAMPTIIMIRFPLEDELLLPLVRPLSSKIDALFIFF
jgi:hypothetical protein